MKVLTGVRRAARSKARAWHQRLGRAPPRRATPSSGARRINRSAGDDPAVGDAQTGITLREVPEQLVGPGRRDGENARLAADRCADRCLEVRPMAATERADRCAAAGNKPASSYSPVTRWQRGAAPCDG
jgi:hypothetical protein